jgi:hypothetical protein
MFDYVFKYLNNNEHKRLLIFCETQNYKRYIQQELIRFLNSNNLYVEKYSRYISFKSNSNEILIASNLMDLLGYSVDNLIIYGDQIDNNILFSIINYNIGRIKYFNKNIIFLRYFKNI